jgi:hypothetical protein
MRSDFHFRFLYRLSHYPSFVLNHHRYSSLIQILPSCLDPHLSQIHLDHLSFLDPVLRGWNRHCQFQLTLIESSLADFQILSRLLNHCLLNFRHLSFLDPVLRGWNLHYQFPLSQTESSLSHFQILSRLPIHCPSSFRHLILLHRHQKHLNRLPDSNWMPSLAHYQCCD